MLRSDLRASALRRLGGLLAGLGKDWCVTLAQQFVTDLSHLRPNVFWKGDRWFFFLHRVCKRCAHYRKLGAVIVEREAELVAERLGGALDRRGHSVLDGQVVRRRPAGLVCSCACGSVLLHGP